MLNFIQKTFLIALLGVSALGYQAKAQKKEISQAESYLRRGDYQNLSLFFNNSVELNFDGAKKSYSKKQAVFVMKDFFSRNKPRPEGFENYHSGKSAGLSYSIVRYDSYNGSYRVFIKIKNYQGKHYIDALDFTKE